MSEETKVTEETTTVTPEDTVETPETKSEEPKTFTQEELDKILAERIARERKKLDKFADYDDVKKKAEELERQEKERSEAELSEVEKLQKRLDELQLQATEAESAKAQTLESANKRLIKSEFRLIAKELGIRKDALDDAFTLSELSSVEVDEEGNVIGVKEAVETLKKAKSYLFGGQNYVDPTAGQHEASRKESQDAGIKQLKDAEAKAKTSGRIEDRIFYVGLKKKLGL